jgi:hypothetical protein
LELGRTLLFDFSRQVCVSGNIFKQVLINIYLQKSVILRIEKLPAFVAIYKNSNNYKQKRPSMVTTTLGKGG